MKPRPDLGELQDNEEADAEKAAWECFAGAHPHEAFAYDPERFWSFFHIKRPNVTREQMVALLKDTDDA